MIGYYEPPGLGIIQAESDIAKDSTAVVNNKQIGTEEKVRMEKEPKGLMNALEWML